MHFTGSIITSELLAAVLDGYALDVDGIHGIGHRVQVERNAL